MRLLFVSNLFPPHFLGGYELLCREVAVRLRERGHDVAVLTTTHGVGEPSRRDEGDGFEVDRELHLTVPFDQAFRFRIAQERRVASHNTAVAEAAFERFRPDLVFAWSQLRLTTAAVRVAQSRGLPVVWAFNDANILSCRVEVTRRRPWRAATALLRDWLTPASTLRGLSFRHAAAISRQLRDRLAGAGVLNRDAEVLYQGIDLGRFPLRDDVGKIASAPRIVYAGQLHEYKGVHTVLEALGSFPARPVPRVTLAGEGDAAYTARLRALADRAGLTVDFLGRVPREQLPALYRAHDLFVFPSIWEEPFGLTHLEAMASGLPTISTANGGQGEFLRDGVNALVFPPGDAAALRERLLRLISDPELARRLALAGRHTVEEGFTLERYVDGLEALLVRAREEGP